MLKFILRFLFKPSELLKLHVVCEVDLWIGSLLDILGAFRLRVWKVKICSWIDGARTSLRGAKCIHMENIKWFCST